MCTRSIARSPHFFVCVQDDQNIVLFLYIFTKIWKKLIQMAFLEKSVWPSMPIRWDSEFYLLNDEVLFTQLTWRRRHSIFSMEAWKHTRLLLCLSLSLSRISLCLTFCLENTLDYFFFSLIESNHVST